MNGDIKERGSQQEQPDKLRLRERKGLAGGEGL
jgi:hypothetical protein